MKVGIEIKKWRVLKNITQRSLAAMVGVESTTITRYENNTREPSLTMLYKLATALGTTVIELLATSPIVPNKENDRVKQIAYIKKGDNADINVFVDIITGDITFDTKVDTINYDILRDILSAARDKINKGMLF